MSSKKLSGYDYRQKKKARMLEEKSMSQSWSKWCSANKVLDRITTEISSRYFSLNNVATDFGFLTGPGISNLNEDALMKHAQADLALKYSSDLNANEMVAGIKSFKIRMASIHTNLPNHWNYLICNMNGNLVNHHTLTLK